MKMRFYTLIAILLWAAVPVYSQAPNEARPFHFSSRGTSFGVQVEFEGTYLIQDDSIAVDVTKAAIYVSEHCPYQGPRAINELKFGLGVQVDSGGKWKIESAAPPIMLGLIMRPREEYRLDDAHFLIPKGRDADLTKRWFVVEIQTDPIPAPEKYLGRGYVFANSCKDIFSQLEKTSQLDSALRVCH